MRLLSHAAADADDQAGILLFELFQRADVAENALLGMFTHRTGVEQNQIGIFQRVAQAEAHILQHAADFLAVVDILLAAIAAHISQRRGFVIGSQRLGSRLIMGISQFFQVNSP